MIVSTRVLKAILAGLIAFPAATNAQCVAARTYQVNKPLQNDVMTMELWHTGRKVCHQRAAEFFADNEDVYQWDCPDLDEPRIKWRVRVTENGKQLDISTVSESGEVIKTYGTSLENFEDWTECSVWSEQGTCKINSQIFEACTWISDSCTNGETCSLCDGRNTCQTPP